jgi:iron complex outermembrane receptor protein
VPRRHQRISERGAKSALLAATAIIALAPAHAQQAPTNLGTVNANANALAPTLPADYGPFQPPPPNSAASVAPSHAPLEAAQPTSVVGKSFIDNSTIPSQNYDELVKFTPSLMNIQPAGPVSQQNYGESIRGFQYNQFNTTFDNLVLPGTISNFAPQSATYFTSHDLGSISIDRGPGTASTIGYATFGGTLALYSKQPLDDFGAQAYSTFGSFGEQLYGIEVDSGAQPELNGGRGFIDLSRLQTGAYLTYVTTNRDNAFGKWEQPIGDNTLVTFVGMYNDSTGDTAYGSTLAQIAKYGPDYGLNNNPNSQAFHGYNFDRYDTDFEYIRIDSNLGDGWNFQETPYTDSYFRSGTEGTDPNGTTPNIEPGGTKAYIGGIRIHPEDDVPGVSKHNDFRDWGSVTRLSKDTPWGQLRVGTWFDYVSNGVYRTRIDFTDDDMGYATKATGSTFNQQYHDRLVTAQPYIEFAWTPLPGLTVTPGVKYSSITRELDTGILGSTPPGETNATYNKAQWSVDAHYKITPDWVAYAQAAKGFLAPPLSTLETAVPATIQPEETTNYQLGTTYQRDRLTVSGDGYYIPFSNYIASITEPAGTLYFNEGNALYRGLEAEATYKLGYGFSLTGNGSLNDARYTNGVHIYQAPQNTAAGGVIYSRDSTLRDHDNIYASLLVKEIGKQYGLNGQTAAGKPTVSIPIAPTQTLDFAVGYTLPFTGPVLGKHKVRVALNLYNLINDHSIIGYAGATAAGTPLFWTDPGFSGFVSFSVSL